MQEVQFADSAFKHGFREEDFFELITGRYLKLRSQKGLEDIYELLGKNLAGDYLHVIYRVVAQGMIRVFHMSRMTEKQKHRFRKVIRQWKKPQKRELCP